MTDLNPNQAVGLATKAVRTVDFDQEFAYNGMKLLGLDSSYQLPTVIWQDNIAPQRWQDLDNFGKQDELHTFSLGTIEDRKSVV